VTPESRLAPLLVPTVDRLRCQRVLAALPRVVWMFSLARVCMLVVL
jgi:hypothetical protein